LLESIPIAPKSTIFKVNLSVADITRGYYESHALTIARHPSATDVRMMVSVMAFALNGHEHIKFAKGMSDPEEPDMWQIDLTGDIQHWIMLGQPEEKRIRQACSKSRRVTVITYQKGAATPWFEAIKGDIERFKHLRVCSLFVKDESLLAAMVERTMTLSCTIEDDQVMLSDETNNLVAEYKVLKAFEK
jgi:uncharacterized protein YaeQ